MVIRALQKWHIKLLGNRVIVYSDHCTLKQFMTQKDPSHQQACWLEHLSQFDIEIQYIKGEDNVAVDALPCRHEASEASTKHVEPHDGCLASDYTTCNVVTAILNVKLDNPPTRTTLSHDKSLTLQILQGYSEDLYCRRLFSLLCSLPNLVKKDSLLFLSNCLVVPWINQLRETLFHMAHDVAGHFGSALPMESPQHAPSKRSAIGADSQGSGKGNSGDGRVTVCSIIIHIFKLTIPPYCYQHMNTWTAAGGKGKGSNTVSSDTLKGNNEHEEMIGKLQECWMCKRHLKGPESPTYCYFQAGSSVCYSLTHCNITLWAAKIIGRTAMINDKLSTMHFHDVKPQTHTTSSAAPQQADFGQPMDQTGFAGLGRPYGGYAQPPPQGFIYPPWGPPGYQGSQAGYPPAAASGPGAGLESQQGSQQG